MIDRLVEVSLKAKGLVVVAVVAVTGYGVYQYNQMPVDAFPDISPIMVPVFAGLVLFFAGFNFLEAGLPARLSLIADDDSRGASLGVFASAQFLGAFVGGLIGGRFLAAGRPADVFFVCVLLAAIWLALQSFGRFRSS